MLVPLPLKLILCLVSDIKCLLEADVFFYANSM